QSAQAALEFSVNDGFGALESALGSFDDFARDFTAVLVSAEFHEAGSDYLGQMAFLVALGNLDSFVNAAIAKCASDCRSKCARLLTSCAVCHSAVDHDADGPARHDEKNDDDGLCDPSHLTPQGQGIKSHL